MAAINMSSCGLIMLNDLPLTPSLAQSLNPTGAATAAINYYRALVRHTTLWPRPRAWAATRAALRMPVLTMMAEGDTALEPGLLNKLEQVGALCGYRRVEWHACML